MPGPEDPSEKAGPKPDRRPVMPRSLLALAAAVSAVAGCYAGPVYTYPEPMPPPPLPRDERVTTTTTTVHVDVRYWGEHPVPDEHGGGWCVIDGQHSHGYQPY